MPACRQRSAASVCPSELSITPDGRRLENANYVVKLNARGDVESIFDKRADTEMQIDLRRDPDPHRSGRAPPRPAVLLVRPPRLGHAAMSRTRSRISNGFASTSSSAESATGS